MSLGERAVIAPSAHCETLPLINDWCNIPVIFLQGLLTECVGLGSEIIVT